jgi:glycosyltransferase involved in cell wall biosynthesis
VTDQNLAIFTICSNNYVSMAKIFVDSARLHHPAAKIYICLADTLVADPGFYPSECAVIPAAALAVPEFEAFSFRYDVMEFNTALKPFMIRHLLSLGHQSILYFDPDIEIFRPLDSVTAALRRGASFVLTPHICRPSEGGAFPDDIDIMRAGTYNLGFLGVGAGSETDFVLRWWARRLQYQCINDQAHGIFVDQKFMDLVPGFATNVHILRDTAMNVAYWNLSQRSLTRKGGIWLVDGVPLGFFHYSGFNPRNLSQLSNYTEAFRDPHIGQDLEALMQHYADRLLVNEHGSIPAGLYAYGKFRSGTVVTDFVRDTFRQNHLTWSGNPFDTYEEYLSLPVAERWRGPAAACITNLMAILRDNQPWLKETFEPAQPEGAKGFVNWFVKYGEELVGDPRLVEPAAERFGDLSKPRRRPPLRRSPAEPDIDVIGYLRLTLGLGEAGRLILRSLAASGLNARGLETSLNSSSSRSDDSCESLLVEKSLAPIQLFCINAEQIGYVIDHLGDALRPDSYRIMTPFWELSNLPTACLSAFDLVDEVWAPTRFIQTMLMRSIDKPVVRMPLTLEFEPPPRIERSRFNLPKDQFLFFFAFDYFSFLERKNPQAVIEAFKRAFRRKGQELPAMLVLKTLNAEIAQAQSQTLRDSLRENPDVILIEQTLPREATLALIAACDAVVSLHRSEGLGLLIAEAMVLGKPAISTDYSATTELVSPETGYPVDYKLIPVKDGDYPFHEGQHWADADVDHAAWQMREVFSGGDNVARKVSAARAHIRASYGQESVSSRQLKRLRMIEGT